MKYPLLAVDLDGTLFTDEKEVEMETITAVHEYQEQGGHVVICSGRSPRSTKWVARTIGLKQEPIIAYNGAILLDGNGEFQEAWQFKQETLLAVWELCEAAGLYAQFYEGDTLLAPAMNKWNQRWAENNIPLLTKCGGDRKICEKLRKMSEVHIVDNFYQYIKGNKPEITKIAVFADDDKLADYASLFSAVKEELEISSSFDFSNLEITPIGISKGATLKRLTEQLGISIKQAAAIGDNHNDVHMLKAAGLGIAMGNAPEKVKEAADIVTASNNHAGVAQAIRRYLVS